MKNDLIALCVGGSIGTVLRYFLTGAIAHILGSKFPYGTLTVNLTGCLILGLLLSLTDERFALGSTAWIFLAVGFCGAFTTFSNFILEISNLVKFGESWKAFFYLIASCTFGFLVFRIGLWLGELI